MYIQRETNPHFLPPEHLWPQDRQAQPQDGATYHFPPEMHPWMPSPHNQTSQTRRGSNPPIPMQPRTRQQPPHPITKYPDQDNPSHNQPHPSPPVPNQTFQTHHGFDPHTHIQPPTPTKKAPHPIIAHPDDHSHSNHYPQPSPLRAPTADRAKPTPWFSAAFCTLFWIITIVAGLAILIIYLVYRPQSPSLDITKASLDAAYLDMGYFLNGHLTLLVNFTNPNRKVNQEFSHVSMDLYFEGNFIAGMYIDHFSVKSGQSDVEVAPYIISQVQLPLAQGQEIQRQINNGGVRLQIISVFRVRSRLGSLLRYSYRLHSRCTILVTAPPNSVLFGRRCVTKR